MMGIDKELSIFLLGIFLIIFVSIFAAVIISNHVEKVNCDTMESQGYKVKLYSETIMTNICLIQLEEDGKFIPYAKIRGYE